VRAAIARFRESHRDAPVLVLEIPLLLESERGVQVDEVVLVTADERSRFGRLRRAGFTERQIIERLGAQMPQTRKMNKADHVIDNSGDVKATRRQVRALAERCGVRIPPIERSEGNNQAGVADGTSGAEKGESTRG
jgi:dephospho-CoA kinase